MESGDAYEYIGTHIDNCMVVAKDNNQVFEELKTQYLLGYTTYVAEVLRKVHDLLGVDKLGKWNISMKDKCHPELSNSAFL
eukprot:3291987-Ditylum_brightwellii.AAC.1